VNTNDELGVDSNPNFELGSELDWERRGNPKSPHELLYWSRP
jgi:hypothetical protein